MSVLSPADAGDGRHPRRAPRHPRRTALPHATAGPTVQNELRNEYGLRGTVDWNARPATGPRSSGWRPARSTRSGGTRPRSILAKEQGLIDSVDHADFLAELADENEPRAKAVAEGRTVYGVTEFSPEEYYSHRLTELTTGLKKRLGAEAGDPLRVTDSDVRHAFDADRDAWSANATTYTYSKLVVPVPADAPSDHATRLQRRVAAAGRLADVAARGARGEAHDRHVRRRWLDRPERARPGPHGGARQRCARARSPRRSRAPARSPTTSSTAGASTRTRRSPRTPSGSGSRSSRRSSTSTSSAGSTTATSMSTPRRWMPSTQRMCSNETRRHRIASRTDAVRGLRRPARRTARRSARARRARRHGPAPAPAKVEPSGRATVRTRPAARTTSSTPRSVATARPGPRRATAWRTLAKANATTFRARRPHPAQGR